MFFLLAPLGEGGNVPIIWTGKQSLGNLSQWLVLHRKFEALESEFRNSTQRACFLLWGGNQMSKPAQGLCSNYCQKFVALHGYMHPVLTEGPVDILWNGIFTLTFVCNSAFYCFCMNRGNTWIVPPLLKFSLPLNSIFVMVIGDKWWFQ